MDEQQFKKIMIKVRSLAKSQGDAISKEQVHDKFLPLNVGEGQFLLIYRYLEEEKVTLYDTEEERRSAGKTKKQASHQKDDALSIYLKELDSLDIPSKEERRTIIEEILKDRNSAISRMPNLYLKEVVDVARLYEGQGVLIDDLIGEGNVGVLTGAGMLDCCETSEEVEEFMMRMIMDSMESLIMDNFSDNEFDLKVSERVNELNDKAKELAEELERKVTVEELVNELGLNEEYIRETIRLSGNAIPYIEGCVEEKK